MRSIMFINEHFPLNNPIITLPVETTLEELASYLNKGTAVIAYWQNEICLFTPEDAGLLTAFFARNIQELVEGSNYFVSAIISMDENNLLPLVPQRTNRPVLFKDEDGTIGGYSILSTYLNFAL